MDHKAPTPTIASLNRGHLDSLPFEDTADFTDADRGFLGALEPCVITAADGRVVWDNDVYEAPRRSTPPRTGTRRPGYGACS